ncbi:hypothetical protein Q5752_003140 [Cryptotrichosporon argae]
MDRQRPSFEDHSRNSVQSLLALLRTSQDGAAPAASPTTSSSSALPIPSSSASGQLATPPLPAVPTSQQLSSLLAALDETNDPSAPSAPSASSTPFSSRIAAPAHPGTARPAPAPSAFSGPRHAVFEAFGPVGQAPSRSPTAFGGALVGAATPRDVRRPAEDSQARLEAPGSSQCAGEGRGDEDGMAFATALPVLTRLLGDDAFVAELRSMKAAQDALERRLWARLEKVRAEHAAGAKRDRELAKLTRQPLTPAKEAQARAATSAALAEARRAALVALDGLAMRHRARLRELGVPGLGGAWGADEPDAKARERVRRIMDVLGGAVDE